MVTAFDIAHKFGDAIRAGWGNILDCLVKLNRISILPESLGSDPESGEGFGIGAGRQRREYIWST